MSTARRRRAFILASDQRTKASKGSMAGTQQQQQFALESARTDTEAAIAELELAVQQNPRQADEWCRLGELYHAMACDAPDPARAIQYRDKAIVALMQAIGLRPGIARAHAS